MSCVQALLSGERMTSFDAISFDRAVRSARRGLVARRHNGPFTRFWVCQAADFRVRPRAGQRACRLESRSPWTAVPTVGDDMSISTIGQDPTTLQGRGRSHPLLEDLCLAGLMRSLELLRHCLRSLRSSSSALLVLLRFLYCRWPLFFRYLLGDSLS